MTYTVRLVGLDCLTAEEIDGDEVYIMLNDAKIWQAHPDKMSHALDHPHQVSQYDFVQGRKLTREGWVAIPLFNPDQFVFKNEKGTVKIQLWDADVLTRDDLLG